MAENNQHPSLSNDPDSFDTLVFNNQTLQSDVDLLQRYVKVLQKDKEDLISELSKKEKEIHTLMEQLTLKDQIINDQKLALDKSALEIQSLSQIADNSVVNCITLSQERTAAAETIENTIAYLNRELGAVVATLRKDV